MRICRQLAACVWLLVSLGAAAAGVLEEAARLRGETLSVGVAGGEVTALAVGARTGRLAIGDARGVLTGPVDRALRRALRQGPVRDLAFLPDSFAPEGELLAATDGGLYHIDRYHRARPLAVGTGGSARAAARIVATADAVVVATSGGAFISRDGRVWQPLSASLPSGAAMAIALRSLRREGGGLECWTAIRGELWRTRLRAEGAALVAEESVPETLPFAAEKGGPVDLKLGLPGADVVVVFPTLLAVRRESGGAWETLRPNLPPGARAVRIAEALGRLWLATDRGLLEAEALAGPWRRARPPAGGAPVRAIAGDDRTLYLATEAGLMAGRMDEPPRAAPPPPATFDASGGPSIQSVHRAAIAYLELRQGRFEQLRRRVKRRGWLPIVTLRGDHAADDSRSTDYDQAFLSGDTRYLVDRDSEHARDWGVALTLTWDFADLAYHPEEVDISRETRELIELRDDVLDEITQLYFERRRVLAELAALADPAAAARLRLRADELAAGIDAWTGGWFTRHAPPLAP
jgi:hypothetical protein